MKSIFVLPKIWRMALCAVLFPLFAIVGRGGAQWNGMGFAMGECEWQNIYVGWCWGTGYECVPGTEDQPWSDGGCGGEVWSAEICSGQYEYFPDYYSQATWYVSYCFNWSMINVHYEN